MKSILSCIVITLAFACLMVRIAAAQETAPASGPVPHDAAFWETLTKDMQLAAQAQRDLKAVTVADHDKLKRLADATADPDIKAQLASRLAVLDEELVLNPTPISIDLKDASLIDVADALKAAMHISLERPRNSGGPAEAFTLTARNKPFWEVFTQLSEQHPMQLQSYDGLRLENGGPALRRFFPAPCGFAVFPMTLIRTKSIDPQRPDDKQSQPLQLNFRFSVACDPRMKIVKYAPPTLLEVNDDAGNNLVIDQGQQSNLWDNQQGQCMFEQTVGLKVPDSIGKKIVSAKGEGHFLVQLAETRYDIDPKTHMNKAIALGEKSVTISQFKVEGSSINFQIQAQTEGGANNSIGMEFVDANDKSIWTTRLNGGSGGGVGGNFVEPVKIRFTVADKTKMITIPFEMKDLPLP